ncbi:MAG: PKD domain-containing protein [Candidatus Bipolaricaulota bacterium]|nr:PKD domain-containing protein [Candidatus Bipolaricaulota bacterium]MDW8126323.1 PKD domain-containing protein [Candidatus Bipolaricaulota bacterium]
MKKLWMCVLLAFVGFGLTACFQNAEDLQPVIETNPNPPRGSYPLSVTFSGEKSRGAIDQWIWTIFEEQGGTIVLSGPVVTYTFRERGKYRVYLEVRAGERFRQTYIDVDVRSLPPVAVMTATPFPEVEVGKTVSFDATSSYDPDGQVQNYVWNFGDGFWEETQDPHVSHKYSVPGEYWVQLVVEDDYGDRSTPQMLRIIVVPKGCGSCG